MRRMPGPADCRLSEGDQSPEALYELFRDWQRTQTQSSVTALQGPRQQMDVWFCRAQEPMPRATLCVENILEMMTCTLSRACPQHPCLHLTDDLHGCRQYVHFGVYFRMPVVARYIVRDFSSQFSSLTENNAGRAASSHFRSCRASTIAGQFDKL
jgi:hypothetical protein